MIDQNETFIPIETIQGISIKTLQDKYDEILVLGTGVKSKQFIRFLSWNLPQDISLSFVHSNKTLNTEKLIGFPAKMIQDVNLNNNILISPLAKNKIIGYEELKIAQVFNEMKRFRSFQSFSRPEAIIELTNNYFYQTPKHNTSLFMQDKLFQSIYLKLISEIQQCYILDLSGSANPINNPDLTNIFKHLNFKQNIVLTLGVTENLDNLASLKEFKQGLIVIQPINLPLELDPLTINNFKVMLSIIMTLPQVYSGEVDVRVLTIEYKTNTHSINLIKDICNELQVRCIKETGYVNPYDLIEGLELKNDLHSDFKKSNLLWDFDEYLKRAQDSRNKPCLCQRIFPVIDFRGRVKNCHLYSNFVLHNNYLEISYEELIRNRSDNENCRKCQKKGYHRLDLTKL